MLVTAAAGLCNIQLEYSGEMKTFVWHVNGIAILYGTTCIHFALSASINPVNSIK